MKKSKDRAIIIEDELERTGKPTKKALLKTQELAVESSPLLKDLLMKNKPEYVVLKYEGELFKFGRFNADHTAESFCQGEWQEDGQMYSELLDGEFELISEQEAIELMNELRKTWHYQKSDKG